ncbi:MAG: DUF3105 domain-containing protein [Actinomycetota bacterium]|nr:DUF3105 domain-containing protein [Actinomycetota bacterium]
MKLAYTTLERIAIVVASLALSVGLIALLSGFFAARDQAGISGGQLGPGEAFADQGSALLAPGQVRPAYDSDPPTSGAHLPVPVLRDGVLLTNDQLLQALALGDVVIMFGGPSPPARLRALAARVAGPFTPALATAGQAVILARRPGTAGEIALAWTHMVRVAGPQDPRLGQFAAFWLGRGAPRR